MRTSPQEPISPFNHRMCNLKFILYKQTKEAGGVNLYPSPPQSFSKWLRKKLALWHGSNICRVLIKSCCFCTICLPSLIFRKVLQKNAFQVGRTHVLTLSDRKILKKNKLIKLKVERPLAKMFQVILFKLYFAYIINRVVKM